MNFCKMLNFYFYVNTVLDYTILMADLVTSKKLAKYSRIKSRDIDLVVVAVDTSGVWREVGLEWIYTIGNKIFRKI